MKKIKQLEEKIAANQALCVEVQDQINKAYEVADELEGELDNLRSKWYALEEELSDLEDEEE
ncbi:MAG: hypothetical protein GY928_24735 [Colwellia sp.]|nr:hypothetical protein [Colwellia sp.]